MSKIGLIVNSNSEITETGISLKELQAGVDGWIEAIDINENMTMWVNEEFLLRSEPDTNPIASAFFGTIGGQYAIHGSVVFTGGTDENGDTLGLGEKEISLIKNLAKSMETLMALED